MNKLRNKDREHLELSRIQSNDRTDFILIPSFILRDRTLSVLESIVEYLKEQKSLTYHQIALLISRDDRTIWTCYNRAKKKRRKNN